MSRSGFSARCVPHLRVEIGRDVDRLGVEARQFGLERLLGHRAALEGGEGLGQRVGDGMTLATPCSVSLRSTKSTNWSDGMAFSSTRSSPSRKAISSSVAPLMRSRLAIVCRRRPLMLVSFRLKPKLLDVGEPQSEVDEVDRVPELITAPL